MHFDELESFLKSAATENNISNFSIAVHKDQKEVFQISYSSGFNTEYVDGDTKHWLYSLTKPVTALMGAIFLEKGIIHLDDKLSKYFPEFSQMQIKAGNGLLPAKNDILLQHLFNMTAGFNYDLFSPSISAIQNKTKNKATTQEVIAALAEEPLDFEPGTAYQYSLCFDVLAAVFEKAAGDKISNLYKNYIFEPLEMNNTGFRFNCKIAPMFYCSPEKEFIPFECMNQYVLSDNYESGGAGLISSVNDYIRFTDLLCNNGAMPNGKRIIAESSVKLFYEHYLPYDILTKRSPFSKCGYSYGFGFRSLISKEFGSKSPIGEFGWDGAAGSFALIDPINNISLVYIQDILYCNYAFEVLHPNIRDLTYSAILN